MKKMQFLVEQRCNVFCVKVVGQNQQQLEVSEENALKREEHLQKQIKELMMKLKIADTR